MSAVYTCFVKLLATFLLLFASLSANSESYYVSNNPATVSNVVEVIQGHKFIVDIAEPHPLAGNITIFLAETYSPKVETPCVKESELGIQAKEYVAQQLATAKNIKLTHYKKTSKGAIAGVSLDGLDLGQNLIKKGLASEDYDYFTAYYCSAYKAMMRGWVNTNNKEEVVRAVFWLERSLELGGSTSTRVQALQNLGWRYKDLGNYPKALEWFTKALELNPNNLDAINGLGAVNSELGNNVQAFKWWKQSAELGNSGSQAGLGHLYLYGEGTAVDLDQAEYWLTKAVEQGDDWAQRNLAELYRLTGDSSKAASQYQVVIDSLTPRASQGDLGAIEILGKTYHDMGNYEKAIEWFKKGAERGHANIMLNLGWAYNELGNYETAFEWFKTSAELGNEWAQDSLGYAYLHGEGTTVDLDKAEYWLTKAVDAGNEWAVNGLGYLYVEAGSYPTALKWFNKALESSNTQLRASAMNGIGKLYQKEGDTRKSVIWWQQAAELGDSSAQSELGYAYLNGNGISRDLELAKKWLTKAAEQGEYWAIKGLAELNE